MYLGVAEFDSFPKPRRFAPEAAQPFRAAERGLARHACVLDREVPVTYDGLEVRRRLEQGVVEAGDAAKLGTLESGQVHRLMASESDKADIVAVMPGPQRMNRRRPSRSLQLSGGKTNNPPRPGEGEILGHLGAGGVMGDAFAQLHRTTRRKQFGQAFT